MARRTPESSGALTSAYETPTVASTSADAGQVTLSGSVDVDVLDEVVLLVDVVDGIGDVLVVVDDEVVRVVEVDVEEVVDVDVVVATGLHSAGRTPTMPGRP